MYSHYDLFDIWREIRRIEQIERMSYASSAQIAMKEFIRKMNEEKSEIDGSLKIKFVFRGFIKRLNKLLPIGHRWRGDVI